MMAPKMLQLLFFMNGSWEEPSRLAAGRSVLMGGSL